MSKNIKNIGLKIKFINLKGQKTHLLIFKIKNFQKEVNLWTL